MPSGDGYRDGEENASPPLPSGGGERGGQTGPDGSHSEPADSVGATLGSGSGSGDDDEADDHRVRTTGCEESSGEPSGGEQGHEDVEMNSGHDSSSGNDSIAGSHRHSSSASRSPGSSTGSGSSKSLKSSLGSSSSSLHSATYGQGRHHTACSEQTEQSRDHTHREMMQALQEMKKRLPSEKRSRSKASTMEALSYALNCVKQVQANSEYYKLLMCTGLDRRKDGAVCTLEQLEGITSEHTLKNTDTFVVVFSLATGRVVYASEQASSILNCKRKFLDSAKFVELLFHQDVNVFYSHTAQPHLPPWNLGTDSTAVLFECAQVKSFFCRIRGGKDRDGEMRYSPFRITPYMLKVQIMSGEENQPCCLALAERITSGYEAPRIPTDKRIFTTTHSPGCVFLEVDDRAVPLLGYLPQDLIGTSLLTGLHPEDRALMLAIHRKILKYAGQPPFEHSPIRFRCQNGDYVTLDTSWSSFVNPWSRKVAFIIGRHKVRTGPLNEDVFAAQCKSSLPVMQDDVKELQATIYKLFLQPVNNNGSSGYGSLGSNGSHEHYISVASSSDSNGNLWEDSHGEPMTLQQIRRNVNKVESHRPVGKVATEAQTPVHPCGQRVGVQGLRASLEETHRKQQHIPSYQQINCVDSIIRYLESCSSSGLKRKCETLSVATSSSSSVSEEDKTPTVPAGEGNNADEVALEASGTLDGQASAESSVAVAHTAAAAVVGAPLTAITLSTKPMSVVSVTSQCSYSSTIVHVPQPESEVTALEDAPMGSEPADPAPTLALTQPAPSSPVVAPEEFHIVGLTKEVLSAHTQKEEQEYVDRFRHRILDSPYSSYFQQDNISMAHSNHQAGGWSGSHSGKPKPKRPKAQDSSDSDGSPPGNFPAVHSPALNNSSSESSQPKPNYFTPLMMPMQPTYYPMPPVPGVDQQQLPQPQHHQPQQSQPQHQQQQQQQPMVLQHMQAVMQVVNPFMAPNMAVILPYPASYPSYPQGVPVVAQGMAPAAAMPTPFPSQTPFFSVMDAAQQAAPFGMPPGSPISPPWPAEELDPAQPTALFSSSRSSSPLQLNLLQEELPKTVADPQSSTGRPESLHEQHGNVEDAPSESGNQDAQSTSSVLLDLLMHEDACSGTGSNASGSGSGESGGSLGSGSGSGSGSNGTSTSHTGSSNSSKYFASNDSSDTSRKAQKNQEAQELATFDKCVEDSLWTMIQQTPEPVMMTYQIRSRDQAQVLKEDREKLLLLQPMQPWFTQDQKKELAEVHFWIHRHSVPEEINTQGCISCNANALEGEDGAAHCPNLASPDSSFPRDCPAEDVIPSSDT